MSLSSRLVSRCAVLLAVMAVTLMPSPAMAVPGETLSELSSFAEAHHFKLLNHTAHRWVWATNGAEKGLPYTRTFDVYVPAQGGLPRERYAYWFSLQIVKGRLDQAHEKWFQDFATVYGTKIAEDLSKAEKLEETSTPVKEGFLNTRENFVLVKQALFAGDDYTYRVVRRTFHADAACTQLRKDSLIRYEVYLYHAHEFRRGLRELSSDEAWQKF